MKTTILCLSIAGALATAANASDVTWLTPMTILGASDVSTAGIFYGSWAPGADSYDPDSLPVNGVTFNTYGSLPGLTGNSQDHYSGFVAPSTPDANYNLILRAGIFNYDTSPITVSWTGMTPGNMYLVQLWVNDGRNATVNARTMTVTGGDNTSLPVMYGSGDSGPGQYVIGTFVADGTGTQSITLVGDASSQLNLLQVRDITTVPEPTSLALLGIGAGAAFLGLRRKMAKA